LLLGENYSPTSTLLEEKYLHIPRAEEIKKRAYQAIVRPNVEYASSAWKLGSISGTSC
jgi:hypothetical protein